MIINVILTLNPFNWQFLYDQDGVAAEVAMDGDWRLYILLISFANSIITILWEMTVVKYVSRAWKEHRDTKERQRIMSESFHHSDSSGAKIN